MKFSPLLALGAAASATSPQYLVWPPAKSIDVNGAPVALSPSFRISSNVDSLVHTAAIDRYAAKVADATTGPTADDANAIESMEINVLDADETLGLETKYDYTLRVSGGRATVNASSIYGAQYAMDSFWQLLDPTTGRLAHSELTISDSPDYAWRGLMIDSGRRFFPLPLVKNLMDTMAGNKMNVLHLHASDMCRFGVESKAFPNLTAALTGIHGGFYTHADIADMVKYGSDRGIRVVPEFDIPGHSRGFIPIESDGATFCTDEASRSQLYGDPGGKTYQVVHTLLREMAGLFPDEVFNIGCDETGVKGPCTQDSTFALERKVLQAIETEFNKTAEGWEEVLFDAGAATNKTIVNAWARHKASTITATGRRAVESASGHFYFTAPGPGGPKGWKSCWYDIATNVPAAEKPLLLGGEVSMWSDSYCYTGQCGASGGTPVGAKLFPPAMDAEFGRSIGGMIWPRGFVAAAAFWNFDASSDPSSAPFAAAIWELNDKLAKAGSLTCPSNCSCDQLTACGQPYIKPPVPAAGDHVVISPCELGGLIPEQQWDLSTGKAVLLATAAAPGGALCAAPKPGCHGVACYPLTLQDCAAATTAGWFHRASGEVVVATGDGAADGTADGGVCLDADTTKLEVGTWACSGGGAQVNQHWSVDAVTGTITGMSGAGADSHYAAAYGLCVTAVPGGAAGAAGAKELALAQRAAAMNAPAAGGGAGGVAGIISQLSGGGDI